MKKTPEYPAIIIPRLWDEHNQSVAQMDDGKWPVLHLKEYIKKQGIIPITLPLIAIQLHDYIFECKQIYEFMQHMKHVQECDPEEPVIMDHLGVIIDGRHRLCRRIMDGKTTIDVYRIPEPIVAYHYPNEK